MKEQTVGVIGGMGPEATVELMNRVIAKTPAMDDDDHIHMIVDNDPKIPSRIKKLLDGTGDDPAPYLANMARKLQMAGVDFLVMPCNTAHLYRKALEEAVSIPVWDMIGLSIKRILNDHPAPLKLGVLASSASIKVGLFEQAFRNSGIHLIYPSERDQNIILLTIKSIKSKAVNHQNMLDYISVVERLTRDGIQYLFVACTELSIIAKDVKYPIPAYDTLEILTDEIISNVKGL